MQISYFLNTEKQSKKRITKKAWNVLLCCLTSCAFVLILQLVTAVLLAPLFEYINFNQEVAYLLQTIILSCVSFVIPFSISTFLFKYFFKNNEFKLQQRIAPKFPILYILGTLGIGYLVNLVLNFCFSGFVDRYYIENDFLPETPIGIALMFIANAILPAILEEWAFRGVICKNLLPYGKKGAIIISSILFGVMHIDPPRIIMATAMGILLSVCYEHTGSLKIPMLIHFLNNCFSTIVVLFIDDGNDETASNEEIVSSLFIYFAIACAIIAIIYYAFNHLSGKKISLVRTSDVGIKLSTPKYLILAIFNVGIIPLGAIYAILYLMYYHSQDILNFFEKVAV